MKSNHKHIWFYTKNGYTGDYLHLCFKWNQLKFIGIFVCNCYLGLIRFNWIHLLEDLSVQLNHPWAQISVRNFQCDSWVKSMNPHKEVCPDSPWAHGLFLGGSRWFSCHNSEAGAQQNTASAVVTASSSPMKEIEWSQFTSQIHKVPLWAWSLIRGLPGRNQDWGLSMIPGALLLVKLKKPYPLVFS